MIQAIIRIPQIPEHGLGKFLTVCVVGDLIREFVDKTLICAGTDLKEIAA